MTTLRTESRAFYRLLEKNDEVFVVDATGNVEDIGKDPTSTPPLLLPAIVTTELSGRGRQFGTDLGLVGAEKPATAAALELTRNVTVRGFIEYKIANASNTDIGTICNRGNRDGTIAERILFGVEIERDTAFLATIRARWQEKDGTDAVVAGVQFAVPGGLFHFGVVRRWIATGVVEVDYIVNGELIGSETVSEGDIGNGVGGTFLVGTAGDGAGDYERFLPTDTVIDRISVESDAMSVEELRQEFRLVTVHQPNGYRVLRAFLPPGFAWTRKPDSRIQRVFQTLGDGLGHSISLVERLRDDYLPNRAYGLALIAWERIHRLNPLPSDTIARRRARVLSFMRTILGFQIDDVKLVLEPSFNLDSSDIDIIEYTALRKDDFSVDDISTPPSKIWLTTGSVGINTISDAMETSLASGELVGPETNIEPRRKASLSARKNQDVIGATLITKLSALTVGLDGFAGVHFELPGQGDRIYFGVRNNAGTREIAHFRVTNGVIGTITTLLTPFVTDPFWLLARYKGLGKYDFQWSTVSAITGFTSATDITGPTGPRWVALGITSLVTPAVAVTGVEFGSGVGEFVSIYEPSGVRPLHWQAFRDPGLGGTFDLETAQSVLDKHKPAHTEACAVTDLDGFALGPTGDGKLGCDPLFPSDQIVS